MHILAKWLLLIEGKNVRYKPIDKNKMAKNFFPGSLSRKEFILSF
jgi:hypothetical protein